MITFVWCWIANHFVIAEAEVIKCGYPFVNQREQNWPWYAMNEGVTLKLTAFNKQEVGVPKASGDVRGYLCPSGFTCHLTLHCLTTELLKAQLRVSWFGSLKLTSLIARSKYEALGPLWDSVSGERGCLANCWNH